MNASGAGRHGWAPTNSANLYGGGNGGVYVCVRACVCVCVCVCTCVSGELAHACARVRDVLAIYDHNI